MPKRKPLEGNEALRKIVAQFWVTPERAEWIPKTDTIPLTDLQEWMNSADIEILGFAYSMMGNARFRIEPPLPLEEYVSFVKRYYTRCVHENPDGEWSDSRFSIGTDLVNIFGSLWRDSHVPRGLLHELKDFLGVVYKEADEDLRLSIIQATLEHLVEQKPIREFFSDWQNDPVLRMAFDEACLWPDGGGRTSLGRPPGEGG